MSSLSNLDGSNRFINKSVLDYFLKELVNSLLRSGKAGAGQRVIEEESAVPVDVAVSNVEAIGFQVGQRIVEKRVVGARRMKDAREVMKFICKEFWAFAFDAKKAPRLQTNNYDTFVIEDYNFEWLQDIAPVGNVDFDSEVLKFLVFPCGLLRGALSSLGVICTVVAECDQYPKVKFTIVCLV